MEQNPQEPNPQTSDDNSATESKTNEKLSSEQHTYDVVPYKEQHLLSCRSFLRRSAPWLTIPIVGAVGGISGEYFLNHKRTPSSSKKPLLSQTVP